MKLKYLAVATGVVALVTSASAVPTLYLSDGTVALTVADNSAFDSDSRDGVVTYNGALGANWTMSVSTGKTKPELGSATDPKLLLSSSSTSKGAGMLTIAFSDDGFGPVSGTLVNSFNGTSAGTVSGATFVDGGNVLGAQSTLLISGLAVGGAQSADFSMTGPFSLTEVITIIHSGSGLTTVGEELSVPDAGLTLAMMGFGLIGLAAFARVQKRAAA
jgi:hypothetical protein